MNLAHGSSSAVARLKIKLRSSCEELGLSEVPAILKELSNRDTLALGIVENVQRADLNPIDEALAYQRLIEEFEESQNSVAQLEHH